MIDAADEQGISLPALPEQLAGVQIEAMNFGRFRRREQHAAVGNDRRVVEPLVVRAHELILQLTLLPQLIAHLGVDCASRG